MEENNDLSVRERYEELKQRAEENYKYDVDYDSYMEEKYGKTVEINSTAYYLYNLLLDNIKDKDVLKSSMSLFAKDFPKYIDEQIDIYEHALYMIKNKEDFYELANCIEIISFDYSFNDLQEEISQYSKQQKEVQVELSDRLSECEELKSKKYNILDLIKGEKKNDKIKLENIEMKIEDTKLTLENVNKNLKELNDEYDKHIKKVEVAKEEKIRLEEKLEKTFKNFTVTEYEDDYGYVDGKFYQTVSLDRLLAKEEEYTKELEILKMMKEIKKEKEHMQEGKIEENYKEMKERQQEEFNSFPIKFAFSDEQFKKAMEELGLNENDKDKIVGIGEGGFMKKEDVNSYKEMNKRHNEELSEAIKKDIDGTGFVKEMFLDELINHEYGYTREIEDTLTSLGITIEDLNKNENLKNGLELAKQEILQYENQDFEDEDEEER